GRRPSRGFPRSTNSGTGAIGRTCRLARSLPGLYPCHVASDAGGQQAPYRQKPESMNLNTLMLTESTGHKPTPEFRFDPKRRWRFDYAWPDFKVALEVQGGIFIQGRHSRGAALLKEWEKLNRAAELGWRILYCQPDNLLKTATLAQLKRTLTS